MTDDGRPCPHIVTWPRLDGAAIGPCDECAPPRDPTLHVTFGGTRANFHDGTVTEQMRENRKAWAEAGMTGDNAPVPVGSGRWV